MATKAQQYLVLFKWNGGEDGEFLIGNLQNCIDSAIDYLMDYEGDDDRVAMFEYPSMAKIDVGVPERVVTFSKDGKVLKTVKV